jgi:hypothetical protein
MLLTAIDPTSSTAANMVQLLVDGYSQPEQQLDALRQAQVRLQAGLKSLQEQRLSYEEKGWAEAWHNQFNTKQELADEVARVLAVKTGA